MKDAMLRLRVHVATSQYSEEVADDVEAGQPVEPIAQPLDPGGVLSIRNGEAVGVEERYLERVQDDELAVVAPHAETGYVDGEMDEQAPIGQIVVPEENAFDIMAEVDVTVLVIVIPPVTSPAFFVGIDVSIIGLLLVLIVSLFCFVSVDRIDCE